MLMLLLSDVRTYFCRRRRRRRQVYDQNFCEALKLITSPARPLISRRRDLLCNLLLSLEHRCGALDAYGTWRLLHLSAASPLPLPARLSCLSRLPCCLACLACLSARPACTPCLACLSWPVSVCRPACLTRLAYPAHQACIFSPHALLLCACPSVLPPA